MTIPLVNKTYIFEGKKVIVNAISWFDKVYIRSVTNQTNSAIYSIANFWKFMMNATYIDED